MKIIDPVIVKNVNDIKRIISEFDPNRSKQQPEIQLDTIIKAEDEHGKQVTYKVSANTKSKSKRDILIEGLEIIKKRAQTISEAVVEPAEVNGINMLPANFGDTIHNSNWVDPLITKWTGGYRDEFTICWDLHDEYIYKYDIFAHKLTRTTK